MTEINKPETVKKCRECNSNKTTEFCKICYKDTQTMLFATFIDTLIVLDSIGIKVKEKGKKVHHKILSGSFSSGDLMLPKGVDQTRSIDIKNDRYDQVITDRNTGKIIHEEHEPLSVHNQRSKNDSNSNKV